MPQPHVDRHWSVFSTVPHVMAGAVGYRPSVWVANHSLLGVPFSTRELPTTKLDRAIVRSICRNPAEPVLFGYVCAMAWGLQGAGPGGAGHVAAAWRARALIEPRLNALRAGGLTRTQAYDLFSGVNAVPGLGPAYFTKLLYFFSPDPNCYIMDQWTGKTVNLLTGAWIVRFAGDAVSNLNKSGNYQAYCEEVDCIAGLRGFTGEQIEETMMSKGGRRPWVWRKHVRRNWKTQLPSVRYSASGARARYPHIPIERL